MAQSGGRVWDVKRLADKGPDAIDVGRQVTDAMQGAGMAQSVEPSFPPGQEDQNDVLLGCDSDRRTAGDFPRAQDRVTAFVFEKRPAGHQDLVLASGARGVPIEQTFRYPDSIRREYEPARRVFERESDTVPIVQNVRSTAGGQHGRDLDSIARTHQREGHEREAEEDHGASDRLGSRLTAPVPSPY